MRRAFSLLLAFMLAGCVSVSGTHVSTAPDTAGITSATLAWADAYNRTTPDAIFDYFKDAAKRPDARVSITDQHVVMTGDMG